MKVAWKDVDSVDSKAVKKDSKGLMMVEPTDSKGSMSAASTGVYSVALTVGRKGVSRAVLMVALTVAWKVEKMGVSRAVSKADQTVV